jgi:ABC-type antimicrobial peptide transport system permease subunit
MRRISVLMLGIAIGAGASTMMSSVRANVQNTKVNQQINAAYRDGLFLGRLDVNQGRTAHVCVGRWSAASDRNSFVAGYEAGYAKAAD